MSASVNKVTLIGNLTRDPEMRHTPKGTAVCEVSLACNRKYKVEGVQELREEVTYVDVTLWGPLGENVHKYMEKGRSVYIEGRLKLDQWDDKETGKKRSKMSVVGEHCQFLGGNPNAGRDQRPANTSYQSQTTRGPLAASNDEEQDDIPF